MLVTAAPEVWCGRMRKIPLKVALTCNELYHLTDTKMLFSNNLTWATANLVDKLSFPRKLKRIF